MNSVQMALDKIMNGLTLIASDEEVPDTPRKVALESAKVLIEANTALAGMCSMCKKG